ncbi:hypothetical protein D1872_304510 [compost metagenome]
MYIVDITNNNESAWIDLLCDFIDSPNLLSGDNAVCHIFRLLGVCANRRNKCYASVHVFCNDICNVGSMIANNGKSFSRICPFLNEIDHLGRNKNSNQCI